MTEITVGSDVEKIVMGNDTLWEKPQWHSLDLLSSSTTGDPRYMVIDGIIIFDGKITVNNTTTLNNLFELPDYLKNAKFPEGDTAYLAESLNQNGTLPTAIFMFKISDGKVSTVLENAQSVIRSFSLYHLRLVTSN